MSSGSFFFGDKDIALLGFMAALYARYQMKRKGGSVPLPGFARSDAHAMDLLRVGMELGTGLPLDDVPGEMIMSIDMDDDRLVEFRQLVADSLETLEDFDPED